MKFYRSNIGGRSSQLRHFLYLLLLLLLLEPSSAQNKYTVDPLPGNWWDVNDDLNEECERLSLPAT